MELFKLFCGAVMSCWTEEGCTVFLCVIRQPSIFSEMPKPDPGQETKDDIVMSVMVSKYHCSQNIAHSQKVFFFSFCCISTESHRALTVSTQWVQSKVCQHLRSLSEAKISSHYLQALSALLIGGDKCGRTVLWRVQRAYGVLQLLCVVSVLCYETLCRIISTPECGERCRTLDVLR